LQNAARHKAKKTRKKPCDNDDTLFHIWVLPKKRKNGKRYGGLSRSMILFIPDFPRKTTANIMKAGSATTWSDRILNSSQICVKMTAD